MSRLRFLRSILLLFLSSLSSARQPESLLAVSQTDANQITVFSVGASERILATVPLACKGPFGLSFTLDRAWLYAACWDQAKIALLNVTPPNRVQIFDSGKWPAWIEARTRSKETWVSDEAQGLVSIYRSGTAQLLSTLPTGGGASDIVFNRAGTRAWVSNETANTVSILDARRRGKLHDVTVGAVPQGMALTTSEDTLLVANFKSDSVSLVDTQRGTTQVQLPVCKGPVDLATFNHAGREVAVVACYTSGELVSLDVRTHRILSSINVGEHPFGVTVDRRRAKFYVCVGGSGTLLVVSAAPVLTVQRSIKLGGNPLRLAFAP